MKFDLDLAGKRVLVTGASQPLGAALAQAFAEQGARVVVQVDKAGAAPGAATAVAADVSTVAGCEQLVSEASASLGGLDVLVNAHDHCVDVAFAEGIEAQWQAAVGGSFKAATFCVKAAAPALKASKGNIVNVTSIDGLMAAPMGRAMRAATAGSIVNMTRMLALRFGGEGVRVNAICAGELEGQPGAEARVPTLGRLGRADDIAATALFLASRMAGNITGSIVVNDGGKHAGT